MTVELAVIGGGPAGLTAAIQAANFGVSVLLIDENSRVGGQLVKQTHKFFGSAEYWAGIRGFAIAEGLHVEVEDHQNIELRQSTVVYGIFRDGYSDQISLNLSDRSKSCRLEAKRIILATGAKEKVIAFPGWTLPGVMGAGAAQTLANVHRVLPGRSILMVGSGNMGLIIAYQLLQAGASVRAVVESRPIIGGYGVHANKISLAGVPILTSSTIKEARGKNRVEEAILVQVDPEGRFVQGTEKTVTVDTICLAVGLSPLVELALMADCKTSFSAELGGYIPIHDKYMRTSQPGIYVAGDVSGIGEADTAIEEGKLAATVAATSLNYVKGDEARNIKARISKRLRSLRSGSFGEIKSQAKNRIMGERQDTSTKQDLVYSEGRSAGYLSLEALKRKSKGFPSENRLKKGKIAVIECVESIPCNPCENVCPRKAITVGNPITNLPVLDEQKCNGCGLCIAHCPGLCIFVLDGNYSKEEALIEFPYEYLPVPAIGETVEGVNRSGDAVNKAKVIDIKKKREYKHVTLIKVSVPTRFVHEIRGIRYERG